MVDYERMRKAIRRESLDGWLFYNFSHRDVIADRILLISGDEPNSRPWVYLFYADREPVKVVHVIEASILDHLQGRTIIYRSREEFADLLHSQVEQGTNLAADFSAHAPKLSFLDHGTALFLERLGFHLTPAGNLIQDVLSTLTLQEIASHETAGRALYKIISDVWQRVRETWQRGEELYEGDIHGWIKEFFKEHDLETEWPLIVGAGKNTALPHYFPVGRGARVMHGDVVQLDIWGKKKAPGSIFADISWVGYAGESAPDDVNKVFFAVRDARDSALNLITEKFSRTEGLCGADIDRRVEESLVASGYGKFIKHRTGHAIDTEVHGFGVNLDAKEFPETRVLREGSCFSVEPGLYLKDYGIRSEIDVYIKNGSPVTSGGEPQRELLLL